MTRPYSHYSKWFASDETRKFVIQNIRRSGIPLELRARKILSNSGFRATGIHYLEPVDKESELAVRYGPGIWRELDIYASRSERPHIKVHDCEIHFVTHILGECKYSVDKDVFVFEHTDKENVDLSRFPVLANGQQMLSPLLARNFVLPVLAEKVTEINAASESKKDGNFSDAVTHGACEQILSALRFFLMRSRETIRRDYLRLSEPSRIKLAWQRILSEGKVERETIGPVTRVTDHSINEFLQTNFEAEEMLRDFPYFVVHIFFPIVVIDESRGVIKAVVDESFEVVALDDIGSCVYLYVSENADRYANVLENSFVLPILMCNLGQLEKAIAMLDAGVKSVVDDTQRYLENNPQYIVKEIMFNEKVNWL